jgi:hypothetical protein
MVGDVPAVYQVSERGMHLPISQLVLESKASSTRGEVHRSYMLIKHSEGSQAPLLLRREYRYLIFLKGFLPRIAENVSEMLFIVGACKHRDCTSKPVGVDARNFK